MRGHSEGENRDGKRGTLRGREQMGEVENGEITNEGDG